MLQFIASTGDAAQLRIRRADDLAEPAHQNVGGEFHLQLVVATTGHEVAEPDRRRGVAQNLSPVLDRLSEQVRCIGGNLRALAR